MKWLDEQVASTPVERMFAWLTILCVSLLFAGWAAKSAWARWIDVVAVIHAVE